MCQLVTSDVVIWSRRDPPPSGRRGLACHPLCSVQEYRAATSLTSWSRVGRPASDRGYSRFPEDPRPWLMWAPSRGSAEAELPRGGRARRDPLHEGRARRISPADISHDGPPPSGVGGRARRRPPKGSGPFPPRWASGPSNIVLGLFVLPYYLFGLIILMAYVWGTRYPYSQHMETKE